MDKTSSNSVNDWFLRKMRDPEEWFTEARSEQKTASVLFKEAETSFEVFMIFHRRAMFHAGLAIENAAKGAILKKKPDQIKDLSALKKIAGSGGHGLVNLAKEALGTLSEEERKVLRKLQEYVIWYGKYPMPAKVDTLLDGELTQNMRVGNLAREIPLIESLLSRLLRFTVLRTSFYGCLIPKESNAGDNSQHVLVSGRKLAPGAFPHAFVAAITDSLTLSAFRRVINCR